MHNSHYGGDGVTGGMMCCHDVSSSGAWRSAMCSLDWDEKCKHFTGHAQTVICYLNKYVSFGFWHAW